MQVYDLIAKQVAAKRRHIAIPYLYGNVLDIGCGKGLLYHDLRCHCNSYCGIDINLNGNTGYEFLQIDIENKTQRNKLDSQTFDCIVMLAVIEHLNNPQEVLHWCYNKIEKGGRIVLTTPTAWGNTLLDKLFKKYTGHTHIFERFNLEPILNKAGFEITKYKIFELGANQLIVGERD